MNGGDASVTWSPNTKFSISGHLRGRQDSNDDLNNYRWENANLSPGAEFWFAPHPRIAFTAGYYFMRQTGKSALVLPAYDG